MPNVEVWIYGGPIDKRHDCDSKLNLVLRRTALEEILTDQLGGFEEVVRGPTIPFLVDARDWACLLELLHREIESQLMVLVRGGIQYRPKETLQNLV